MTETLNDLRNPGYYIPKYLRVLTKANKQGVRKLVPMSFEDYPAQRYYLENHTNRDITLKNRQAGFSTIVEAIIAHKTFVIPYQNSSIVAHDEDTAMNLFQTFQRFHDNLPADYKPKKDWSSGTKMRFPALDSYIYIDGANSDHLGLGRSLTNAHLSEVAKWHPNKAKLLFTEISQTVPEGGYMVLECYDDKTEILTENGWKLFSEIRKGEKVLSKDANGKGYYVLPEKIIKLPYKGNVLQFSGKHVDLLVTPNHMMWIRSNWGVWQFREAEELKKVSCKISFDSKMEWEGEDIKYFHLPAFTDYHNKYYPKVKIPMDIWVRFMGYFLSEGWIQKTSVTAIGQDMRSTCENDIAWVVATIAHYLHKSSCITKNKNCMIHHISSPQLARYLLNFTKPKRLPDYIRNLNPLYLELFIETFKNGDGDSYWNRLYNTSKVLIDSLQEICLKLGYNTNLYPHKGRADRWEIEWVLSYWNDKYIDFRQSRNPIKDIPYDGNVYCVTVPTHLIMVRRNGKALWCGNSTPHGRGGLFYDLCQAAKRHEINYRYFFFPWWWDSTCVRNPKEPFKWTSEELELKRYVEQVDKLVLTDKQIAFRREKIAEIGDYFYQEFPENDVDCWLGTEASVFDGVCIRRYMQKIEEGKQEGALTIWKDVIGGEKYVVGVDVASGQENGDYSVACVLKVKTNEYVARMKGRIAPDLFAEDVYRLGKRYNYAEIGVEKAQHGRMINRTLLEKNYPNLYYHRDTNMLDDNIPDEPGWKTSSNTKPVMIADLQAAIRAGDIVSWSENLMNECASYMYDNSQGSKFKKAPGCFDDEIDALAIALQLRNQAPILESQYYKPISYVKLG